MTPVRTGSAALRSRAPLAPRRVSGPVKRPQDRRPTRPSVRPRPQQPLRTRASSALVAFVRSLPDHRWLDRLVRGRAWIPVMGVLLAGIVATQVEVLKLGASMGRWVSRGAALSSRNQSLQASVAALSDDQRIERLAAQMGMIMPAPTDVNFLALHPAGGVQAALRGIHAPDSTQFLDALAASQAAALAAATPTPPPSTTVTPTSSTAATTTTPTTVAPTTTTPATVAPTDTTPTTVAPSTTATTPTTVAPATTTTAAPSTQTTGATSPTGGVTQSGG